MKTDLKIIKQYFKIDHLILFMSLSYAGLFFSGGVYLLVLLLFTLAVICGRISYLSFQFLLNDTSKMLNLKGLLLDDKKNIPILLYGIISSVLFVFLSFLINDICYYISILSVILIIGFPLLKRNISLPCCKTGFFEAMCPIGGYVAVNNRLEFIPFVLFAFVLFWTTGTGIAKAIYETRKEKDSRNYFISRFGFGKSQMISFVFFMFCILMLILAGFIQGRGLAYWISLLCFAIIILRQEVLLKSRDAETSKAEFFQINNFVAPMLLVGILIDIFYK